jgi:hypothetical protein
MSHETAVRQWLTRVPGGTFAQHSGQTAQGRHVEVAPEVTHMPLPPSKPA